MLKSLTGILVIFTTKFLNAIQAASGVKKLPNSDGERMNVNFIDAGLPSTVLRIFIYSCKYFIRVGDIMAGLQASPGLLENVDFQKWPPLIHILKYVKGI